MDDLRDSSVFKSTDDRRILVGWFSTKLNFIVPNTSTMFMHTFFNMPESEKLHSC